MVECFDLLERISPVAIGNKIQIIISHLYITDLNN